LPALGRTNDCVEFGHLTISSATVLNGSSSEIEEIESDTYSSDIGASDRNMSLLSEMYLEASKINKSENSV